MNSSGKPYRLRCRCSADLHVSPGQAGTRLTCPACGTAVDVPRLRDLQAVASPVTAGSRRRWRRSNARCFAGSAIAATAGFVAATLSDGFALGRVLLPDDAMIRSAVQAADPATIHKAWLGLRAAGVDRGAIPEELRVQRATRVAGRIRGMLWGVAMVGLALAVAGALESWSAGGGAAASPGEPT